MHLDIPSALYPILHVHAAGYGEGDVDPRGVQDFSSVLVLAPVVVAEEGGLRLGYAARQVFPHVPVHAGPPVVVADVPRSEVPYGCGYTPPPPDSRDRHPVRLT